MIEYRHGSLLKQTDLVAICHQCNCFTTMGVGIAKEIKKQYPQAFQADVEYIATPQEKLGEYSMAEGLDSNGNRIFIFNLYGQYRYGRETRHTDYEALEISLIRVRGLLESFHNEMKLFKDVPKIGIPYRMGCRNAGGDWDIVEKIIRTVFEESPIQVVIIGEEIPLPDLQNDIMGL